MNYVNDRSVKTSTKSAASLLSALVPLTVLCNGATIASLLPNPPPDEYYYQQRQPQTGQTSLSPFYNGLSTKSGYDFYAEWSKLTDQAEEERRRTTTSASAFFYVSTSATAKIDNHCRPSGRCAPHRRRTAKTFGRRQFKMKKENARLESDEDVESGADEDKDEEEDMKGGDVGGGYGSLGRGGGKSLPFGAHGGSPAVWPRMSGGGRRAVDGDEEDELHSDRHCPMYPNGTFNAPFAVVCPTTPGRRHDNYGVAAVDNEEDEPPIFVVHETAFSNETGDYAYPLDLARPLRVFLDITSYATRRYESMRVEVALYRRKTGWMGCGWMFLPTFGSLDNVEICEPDNPSCPVYPGRQVLEMKIKPNPLLISFIKMMHDSRVPYQLKFRIINNRHHSEELLCVMFQTRIVI